MRVWPLAPLEGNAKTLSLWVEAYTGTELQAGTIRPLSDAEWKARSRATEGVRDEGPTVALARWPGPRGAAGPDPERGGGFVEQQPQVPWW